MDVGNWKLCIVCRSLARENLNHSYRAAGTKNLSENLVYREKGNANAWHRQQIMGRKEREREEGWRGGEKLKEFKASSCHARTF